MAIKSDQEKLIFYSMEGESLKKLHIYESGVSAGFPSCLLYTSDAATKRIV